MQTKQTRVLLAAGFATLIILLGGWYAINQGALVFDGWKPSVSVAELQRPSLDRPISFPEGFNEEAQKIYNDNLERVKGDIRANPTANDPWMDLAIAYRQVNYHEGAVEIWEYLLARNPNLSIPLRNLGEYHFHYAKDYPKAEEFYLRSLELSPDITQNYYDLFDMYRYVYKTDTDAAVEIMEKGISTVLENGVPAVAVNDQVVFKIMLGQYFLEKGDNVEAMKRWEDALAQAKKINAVTQAKEIQNLISSLK